MNSERKMELKNTKSNKLENKSKKIFQETVEGIKPTDESLLKEVDAFVKKINAELSKNKIKAKTVVGGSVAKNTYLKKDHDCDLFVRFDYSYKDKDISKLLGNAIKSFKPEILHGSRDYYSVKSYSVNSKAKNKIHYEIVPVLAIKKPQEALNVTDMSPLHVEWVKKHPGMCDEIRLAKQFCKAAGVYGAESYIKGFSGHVIDILVIHYGGFLKLLKASQKWKEKEVIDPEKYYKKDALQKLNKSKIDSPIIIIDPVLPERNAAASLSYEKYERFVNAASDFLSNPGLEHFIIKEKTIEDIEKEAGNNKLLLLEAEAVSGKDDVVGAKILKAYQQIRNQLTFYDFEIKGSGWKWDRKKKAVFWYFVNPKELLALKKWIGPPVEEKERAESFRQKYKKVFVEEGRVCTYVKRRYIEAEALLKDILNDPQLRERVKKIKLVKELK